MPKKSKPDLRILVAPNAFKGSLTALEAARAMRRGVLSVLSRARVVLMPISDGGDGLIEALLAARGGRRISVSVRGPLGRRRAAVFGWLPGRVAVVEMSRASGLALMGRRRDPLGATTYGTGELIADAVRRGAKTVLVGLGGSASSDGGAGMASALGANLLDRRGREIVLGARGLLTLASIEASSVGRLMCGVRVIGVSDVTNPLTGTEGSARVYGPQKGASPAQVRLIEKAFLRYAAVLKRDLGRGVARVVGSGAAGGLGAGLVAFLDAKIVPGADFVLDELGASARLKRCDAVLTGEGRLDSTSFFGKAPVALARRARAAGVPVAAVCAAVSPGVKPRLRRHGIMALATFAEAGAGAKDTFRSAWRWTSRAAALAVVRLGLCGLFSVVCAGGAFGAASPEISRELAEIDRLYFSRHQQGCLEESLAKIEALLESRPEEPRLWWRQGRSLARLGERQESKKDRLRHFLLAEEKIKKSIELEPSDPDSHFWLGLAMGRRGETQGILKSLFLVKPLKKEMETVLRLNPNHGGAHHILGELYRQLPGFAGGSKKRAVAELEEALRLEPLHSSHHTALAEAYLAVKDKQRAAAVLRLVSEIKEPKDPAEYQDDLREASRMLDKLGEKPSPDSR